VAAGSIIAQDPEAGSIVPIDSVVELTLSSGPPPDFGVQIDDLSQSCNGTCEATVTFTITTLNRAPVREPFDVLIEVSPDAAITIQIGGLEAGQPVTRSETLDVGNGCFVPDCSAIVTVDPEERFPDPNRDNNRAEFTDSGID
jgi:hypothetical protein